PTTLIDWLALQPLAAVGRGAFFVPKPAPDLSPDEINACVRGTVPESTCAVFLRPAVIPQGPTYQCAVEVCVGYVGLDVNCTIQIGAGGHERSPTQVSQPAIEPDLVRVGGKGEARAVAGDCVRIVAEPVVAAAEQEPGPQGLRILAGGLLQERDGGRVPAP